MYDILNQHTTSNLIFYSIFMEGNNNQNAVSTPAPDLQSVQSNKSQLSSETKISNRGSNNSKNLLVVLLSILLLLSVGAASYFYMNSENESICEVEQCTGLGMVKMNECANYVDCPTTELEEPEEAENNQEEKDADLYLKTIKTISGPTNLAVRSGKYFITYEVCNKWDSPDTVVVSCAERESVEFEMSAGSFNIVSDNSGSASEISTEDLFEKGVAGFEGFMNFGEGAGGNKLTVVNDELVVAFIDHN